MPPTRTLEKSRTTPDNASSIRVYKPHEGQNGFSMAFLRNEQKQTQAHKLLPKLYLTHSLLQLNVLERTQTVENELLENPALELLEPEPPSQDSNHDWGDPVSSYFKEMEHKDPFLSLLDAENSLASLQTPIELKEHLNNQLHLLSLSPEEFRIASYIIGNLDGNGFLSEPLESLAEDLHVPSHFVEQVLVKVQSLEPAGIAARDLRECLLLQTRYMLNEIPIESPTYEIAQTAYRILKEAFDDFVHHRQQAVRRKLHISNQTLYEAMDFITTRLTPYPAAMFGALWSRPFGEAAIRPDVIIHRTSTGFLIEVTGIHPSHLRISPAWSDFYVKSLQNRTHSPEEEVLYVKECVRRATTFIESFRNCHQILRTITQELILHQTGFIETGQPEFLRPLTRQELANRLGVHSSVVSRATINKYVRLPNLEVYPFDIFFDYSHAVKATLKKLVENEDPAHPLTDGQLTQQLQKMGFNVARRTVVKYREQCHILSSHQRRRYKR